MTLVLHPCPHSLHRRTLADLIIEKLTEKQTEVETVMSEVSGFPLPQLDPRVLEVYRGVREVRTVRACAVRKPLTHGTRRVSHGGQDRKGLRQN